MQSNTRLILAYSIDRNDRQSKQHTNNNKCDKSFMLCLLKSTNSAHCFQQSYYMSQYRSGIQYPRPLKDKAKACCITELSACTCTCAPCSAFKAQNFPTCQLVGPAHISAMFQLLGERQFCMSFQWPTCSMFQSFVTYQVLLYCCMTNQDSTG